MKGFFSIGKKGSLVLALALALVCLLAAGAAWAEETGTCGANLRWTLSDQGTLKITGTGPMTDYAFYDGYSSGTQSPWVSSGASFFISRIEIGEGVTSVGSYAFIYFDMLEEVSLPSTLTQIGESAFEQSPNLRAVSFPAALKSIGANAFHDCAALEEASFAEGLQSIGDSAFSGCGSLVSVGLPSTVRTIGRASFQGCASLRQVMLPAGLTAVPDSAFKSAGDLTYIYLPDTVTTVGTGAFEGTAGGFTVYCGEGSRAARWAAGEGYPVSLLTADRIVLPDDLQEIDAEAFAGLSGTQAIVVPASVSAIARDAFKDTDVILSCPAGSYTARWALANDVPVMP